MSSSVSLKMTRPDWIAYPESEDLHHVVYEFDILDFTADWLVKYQQTGHDWMKNAVLEYFTSHVRNIIAFLQLVEGNKHKSDLKASDYVEDIQKWTANRDSITFDYETFDYETLAKRANKHIAHLTKDRLDPRGKGWSMNVMLLLRQQELVFYSNLKPELRRGVPRQRPTLFQTLAVPPQDTTSSIGSVVVSSGSRRVSST